MTKDSQYKVHYNQFAQNVAFAVRAWHHHVHLNNRANESEEVLDVLNRAPRYWKDQRYIAVQTTIIFLGKIFDTDKNAHNIDKTLSSAHKDKGYFSKEELRKRKIGSGNEFEGIDEYIDNATELSSDDLRVIANEVKKAKNIWEIIKPLRDKVYAHNQMLSDDEREALYGFVKNKDINDILQILLNISNALWEAEFNGRTPNFSSDYTSPIEWAKKDIEELIKSLLHQ